MSDVKSGTTRRRMNPESPDATSVGRVRRPRREDVRRRLLDAALEVFAEYGFASASLDQVAAAADLTKGAIYSNFASKDELFFAMMTDQILTRVEAVRAVLAANPAGTPRRRALQDIGRRLTEAFVEQREWQLVFLDFWQRAVRDDEVRAQFLAHRRNLREAIADRVVQVFGTDPIPGDFSVDDVVTVVLALSNGLAIEMYVDPGLVSDDLLGRVLERLSR